MEDRLPELEAADRRRDELQRTRCELRERAGLLDGRARPGRRRRAGGAGRRGEGARRRGRGRGAGRGGRGRDRAARRRLAARRPGAARGAGDAPTTSGPVDEQLVAGGRPGRPGRARRAGQAAAGPRRRRGGRLGQVGALEAVRGGRGREPGGGPPGGCSWRAIAAPCATSPSRSCPTTTSPPSSADAPRRPAQHASAARRRRVRHGPRCRGLTVRPGPGAGRASAEAAARSTPRRWRRRRRGRGGGRRLAAPRRRGPKRSQRPRPGPGGRGGGAAARPPASSSQLAEAEQTGLGGLRSRPRRRGGLAPTPGRPTAGRWPARGTALAAWAAEQRRTAAVELEAAAVGGRGRRRGRSGPDAAVDRPSTGRCVDAGLTPSAGRPHRDVVVEARARSEQALWSCCRRPRSSERARLTELRGRPGSPGPRGHGAEAGAARQPLREVGARPGPARPVRVGVGPPAPALAERLLAVARRAGRLRRSSTTATPTRPAWPARCPAARRSWPRWPWRWPWPSRWPARARGARTSSRSSSTRASARSTPTPWTSSPAAMEDLGAGGRMVGLVSHVPELAERVPVRFEVRRGARGSIGRAGGPSEVRGRDLGARVRLAERGRGAGRDRGRRSTSTSSGRPPTGRRSRRRPRPVEPARRGLRRRRAPGRGPGVGDRRRRRRAPGHLRQLRRRCRPLRTLLSRATVPWPTARSTRGAVLPRRAGRHRSTPAAGTFGLRVDAGRRPRHAVARAPGRHGRARAPGSAPAPWRPASCSSSTGPSAPAAGFPARSGYVKTHHVSYLPAALHGRDRRASRRGSARRCSAWESASPATAGTCGCRARSSHPWAGVVRCEATADLGPDAGHRPGRPPGRGAAALRVGAAQGPPRPAEPLPDRRPRAGAAPPPGRSAAASSGRCGRRPSTPGWISVTPPRSGA